MRCRAWKLSVRHAQTLSPARPASSSSRVFREKSVFTTPAASLPRFGNDLSASWPILESPWEGLVGGAVLGEKAYAQSLLSGRKVNEDEQTPVRSIKPRMSWEQIVAAAEKIKGGAWRDWAERHGDWGRDAAMYVAVRHGRMRLAEVVREVGVKYQAAAQGVKRFGVLLATDPERQRFVAKLQKQLSTF